MKKISSILFYFFLPQILFAQSFQEGNILIKGGLGISSPYYWKNAEGVIPPLNINVDYALKDKIGVGGILGYTASKYTQIDNAGKYVSRQTYRLIGGRATYHFWNKEHYDLYIGGMMGYIQSGWKVTYKDQFYAVNEIPKPKYGGFVVAGFAGLNYSINNDWGVFGEVGYNLSFITGGAYWRFSKIK
jgi:hypothetical protein